MGQRGEDGGGEAGEGAEDEGGEAERPDVRAGLRVGQVSPPTVCLLSMRSSPIVLWPRRAPARYRNASLDYS